MGAMYEEKKQLALVLLLVVAALAAVSSSMAVPLPLPKWEIHVVNGLSHENLFVHCKSKDDDLGNQTLAYKDNEFHWTFKVNFFGTTLYWCYLQKPNFDVSFESFWVEKTHPWLNSRCYHNDCYWIAKDDGIYLRNNPANTDELVHNWNKWT